MQIQEIGSHLPSRRERIANCRHNAGRVTMALAGSILLTITCVITLTIIHVHGNLPARIFVICLSLIGISLLWATVVGTKLAELLGKSGLAYCLGILLGGFPTFGLAGLLLIVLLRRAAAKVMIGEPVSLVGQDVERNVPYRWRLGRVVAILIFLFFAWGIGESLLHLATTVFAKQIRAVGGRYGQNPGNVLDVLSELSVTVLMGVFLAASMYYSRTASLRICASRSVSEKNLDKETTVIIAGAACALFFAAVLGLPSNVVAIACLVSFVGSLYVVFSSDTFRWRNYLVAGLALGVVSALVEVPTMMTTGSHVEMHRREKLFEQPIRQISKLFTHEDLINAVKSDSGSGSIPELGNGILVLDAESDRAPKGLSVSEVDPFVPDESSTKELSSLRAIVVFGRIGGEKLWDRVWLVAPILVYSWPDKKLLLASKYNTGCLASDAPQTVYAAMAHDLVPYLQRRAESLPNPN